MGWVIEIMHHELAQAFKLFYHRWDYHIHHSTDDADDEQQGDDDCRHTIAHPDLVLDKEHYRMDEVSQQPCHEERQKHTAEIVGKPEYSQYKQCSKNPTDKEIESDCLLKRRPRIYRLLLCHIFLFCLKLRFLIALSAQRFVLGRFS